MYDREGVEWLPVAEAARRVRVRESAIYVWTSRGTVRAWRYAGRSIVNMPDVMNAEHAWRQRVRQRARQPDPCATTNNAGSMHVNAPGGIK